MQDMTTDVLMAIIQSNLAAYMGEQIDPHTVKILCAQIRDSIEHYDNKREAEYG